MLHWWIQSELSATLVDQSRAECYTGEFRQKLSATPVKLGVLCAVVRAWVSLITHRCVSVRAWETVSQAKVRLFLT